jgi:KipI family sensor histidine kinase inhibitor
MNSPTLLPLGDRALLVRFSTEISDSANLAAVALAQRLRGDEIDGVEEVAPGLVSVLLRLRSAADLGRVRGEVMLRIGDGLAVLTAATSHRIEVNFDGEDLAEIARRLSVAPDAFVRQHNVRPLRVLATGFAPGFVYCGFHDAELMLPRRESVRPMVPAGTVLFAAGQTAISATPIRTGWHIIGRTSFQNFDPAAEPPTKLRAGDQIVFEAVR